MIAVDTNILVYAHRADSPWHERALKAMMGLAEGTRQWAIPWPCVHEFLAVVTHPRLYQPPSPLPAAVNAVRAWSVSPMLIFIGEADGHLDRLETVAARAKVAGPMIHDARIVALCLGYGVRELWSSDRDFRDFPVSRW